MLSIQHCVQGISLTILNATFFFEASYVVAFDLCLGPVQRDSDIQCPNNVVFFCDRAASFSVPMAFSSSIGYLNKCIVYNYILVNY